MMSKPDGQRWRKWIISYTRNETLHSFYNMHTYMAYKPKKNQFYLSKIIKPTKIDDDISEIEEAEEDRWYA